MVPKKVLPYFITLCNKTDGYNYLVEGTLVCCSEHDFGVLVLGEVKRGVFSKLFLCLENDKTVMKVLCKKCGKIISVFDSSCDGLGQCEKENNQAILMAPKYIDCIKCHNNSFSVNIKYEYPDIRELETGELKEIDNAFTWISVTLECNQCGTRYKNFIDFETD